ncbi:MAG: glycosyltransferase family 2 protein [Pseudomonadota bacterium]
MADQHITVVVPTYKRPDGLSRAVRSLFDQARRTIKVIDVIIVDNDPEHSARDAMSTLRELAPKGVNIIALHEPRAGVSNARNAAMDAVGSQLVAFLDDDQSAESDWLEALMQTHCATPAAVTFGPVITALEDTVIRHRSYYSSFFARDPGHEEGYIEVSYGCGNSLLDLDLLPPLKPLFDPRANKSGGEDDLLYAAVVRSGGKFAWSAEARVAEHVPVSRSTLRYTLARAFSFGQGPCTLARRHSPPKIGSLLMWMGIGAGQFLVHGTFAAVLFVFRRESYALALDRAVRGLGKVFWFHGLDFYGSASQRDA